MTATFRSVSDPHLIIGNPQNRRVVLFCEALKKQNQPEPTVLSHQELVEDVAPLARIPDEPCWVRIDSTGENADLERTFLRAGWQDACSAGVSTTAPDALSKLDLEHGQIVAPRQRHFGFLRYLRRLHEVFRVKRQWRVLSPVSEIEVLFNKCECSAKYRAAGIPVPEPVRDIGCPGELRDRMATKGIDAVYVKMSASSSASCLAVFFHSPRAERLMTTICRTGHGWFNSLRVQRLGKRADIDEVLSFLIAEGSQIEVSVPKARLDGAFMDCRMLAIAGEPRFTVVRQNRHPITNLHLGGVRGRVDALLDAVPKPAWERALQSVREVAKLHGCHQLGVDVMFTRGFREHCVLESNAFGDLLPGLEKDGMNVYEWQIRTLNQSR